MKEQKNFQIKNITKWIWISIFIASGIGVLLSLIGSFTETYTVYYKYYYLFLTFWTNWTVFIYYGLLLFFFFLKKNNILSKIANIRLRYSVNSWLIFVFFAVVFLFIPIYFFSWIDVINFDAFPDYVGSTYYSGKSEPIIVPGLESFILHFIVPILLIIELNFITKEETEKLNQKRFKLLLYGSIYLLFYLFFVETMAFVLPTVSIEPGTIDYDYFRIYPYTILSYQYFPIYLLVIFILYLTLLYLVIFFLFRKRLQIFIKKIFKKGGKNE